MIDESLPLILPFFARQKLAKGTLVVTSFVSLYSFIFKLILILINIDTSH